MWCWPSIPFVSIRCKNEHIGKNQGRFTQKKFIDKQTITKRNIRSGNLIIFDFENTGDAWASKEAKPIIHIAFFYSKFM